MTIYVNRTFGFVSSRPGRSDESVRSFAGLDTRPARRPDLAAKPL